MPITTTDPHGKFTRRVSKNDIAPKDGSEPLTVIEFSLTNEVRDSLKKALAKYRKGPQGLEPLAEVIKQHFPEEVLEELSGLAKKGGSPSTIYVVKNLPKDKVPEHFNQKYSMTEDDKQLSKWGAKESYTYLIGRGVEEALGLSHHSTVHLIRRKLNWHINGGGTHKHPQPVSLLAGVASNGASTRFTDMGTLLEALETSVSPNVLVGAPTAKNTWPWPASVAIPLKELPEHRPRWNGRANMHITPYSMPGEKSKRKTNEKLYDELVQAHSQEVVVGAGDLALWAEDGKIFHEAIKGPQENYFRKGGSGAAGGELLRYTISMAAERPQRQR